MSVYAAGPSTAIAVSVFPNGVLAGSVLFLLSLWVPAEVLVYLSHLLPTFKRKTLKGRVAASAKLALLIIFSYAILTAFSVG